ncbi:MAG TPA: histone deacetylase [Solirubrobacteraceae bacterium]
MPQPILLRHESSREHDTGAHPERIARIVAIERALHERGWLGWDVRDSPAVERDALLAVHPAGYVERIEAVCAAGGGALDVDTIVSEGSYRAGMHAAGGAMAVVDALLGGEAPPKCAASVHRPPGHHALATRALGFCLFNNAAIAARAAQAEHGLDRVAILDWDVHHGNGTQDIFWDDPSVLYISLHQWPFYPGTGRPGEGNATTLNVPLPAGSGNEDYLRAFEEIVEPAVSGFEPELLIVSAGFDAHADDPLASMEVTGHGFRELARRCRGLAPRVAAVLEGGYNLETLPGLVHAALDGFS